MNVPTVEQLQEWIREYKPILGLQNWNIVAELVRGRDLEDHWHFAECHANYEKPSAVLKFCGDVKEQDYCEPKSPDYEVTVVHELPHCRFDVAAKPGKMGRTREIEYERAIHATAEGIVRLNRQLTEAMKSPPSI